MQEAVTEVLMSHAHFGHFDASKSALTSGHTQTGALRFGKLASKHPAFSMLMRTSVTDSCMCVSLHLTKKSSHFHQRICAFLLGNNDVSTSTIL